MRKMPVFLVVAMAALTLASCKREEEQAISSPKSSAAASTLARPVLLAAGNWRQTALTVTAPNEATNLMVTSDLFPLAKPSMLIRSAAYKPDGTFTLLRGALTSGQFAEPVTGQWHLNAANDSIIIIQKDYTRTAAVAELTATTLRLVYTEPAAKGKVAICTSTFTH